MTTMTAGDCPNCGLVRSPESLFCEKCGYDFLTETLPDDGADVDGGAASATGAPSVLRTSDDATSSGDLDPEVVSGADRPSADHRPDGGGDESGSGPGGEDARVQLRVEVDRSFFDEVVKDGELEFPDPVPGQVELELAGPEIHIGRTSESRAIHPDVDVADLTGDQAVSSRHAVLRVAGDGTCHLVDIGSTNGTFVGQVDAEPLEQGAPVLLAPGTAVYLGAWTRITVIG